MIETPAETTTVSLFILKSQNISSWTLFFFRCFEKRGNLFFISIKKRRLHSYYNANRGITSLVYNCASWRYKCTEQCVHSAARRLFFCVPPAQRPHSTIRTRLSPGRWLPKPGQKTCERYIFYFTNNTTDVPAQSCLLQGLILK